MMRDWSIKRRVLLLALVPSLTIVVVLTTLFTFLHVRETERALELHGMALGQHVARAAEFSLFSGDQAELQRIADAAHQEPDVAAVRISDVDGRTVARAGGSDPEPGAHSFVTAVTASTLTDPDLAGAQKPAVLGQVLVVMSPRATLAATRDQWRIGMLIGLVGIALALMLALLIANSVTRPIRRIAATLERIAGGRLEERIEPKFGGELRSLANSVNQMAAALQASYQNLEERINQATQELQEQTRRAQSASDAKSRFLAAASHDLRQPLHAISLFATALRQESAGEQARALGKQLGAAISAMDEMFESLLDVYRLDAGELRARPRDFPVQELLRSLESEFRGLAEATGTSLRIVPTTYWCNSDPMLVRRILGNLVSNAVHYARGTRVLVACRREGERLRLEVRDAGPGIAPEEHQRIFLEFYRLARSEKDRGRGLGLSIVARMAELLQSRVALRSAPDRGSTFSIGLARAKAAEGAVPQAWPAPLSLQGAALLSVLVVDDDESVLLGTMAVARDWGVAVATAQTLERARQEMLGFKTEIVLVVCDMWLAQGPCGVDVLATLRTQWPGEFHGVIITGDARTQTLERIQAAGFPVMQKPVAAARLRAMAMHCVGRRAAPESKGTQT